MKTSINVRYLGAAAVVVAVAVMAAVIGSVRATDAIATWHFIVYALSIGLAGLGTWSLATGLAPWKPPARRTARFHLLHPRFFFVESWRTINEEAFAGADVRGGRGRISAPRMTVDHRVIVVFLVAAFTLTLMEYFGDRSTLYSLCPDLLVGRYGELNGFAYWALWRVLGYAVIPGIAVLATPGMSLSGCGLTFRGFFEHLWIYALLFLVVLACVVFVSFKPDFASYYPFYKQAHLSWFDFLAWEILYALQFVSLEFFFRGFMLHPLRRSLGAYSILAMMVPYCMIHYGKPYLEANAAIIAGVVLGTLSLRTGSIWCGALIHITVAVSMDIMAMYQSGHLATLLM